MGDPEKTHKTWAKWETPKTVALAGNDFLFPNQCYNERLNETTI